MADLASAAYSAGFLGEEAKHTNWAQALGNTLGAASRTVGDVDRLLNAITTQEDAKGIKYINEITYGASRGSEATPGFADQVLDPADFASVEEYQSYMDDVWSQNVTVEALQGIGLSRAASERIINNIAPDLKISYDTYQQQRYSGLKTTEAITNQEKSQRYDATGAGTWPEKEQRIQAEYDASGMASIDGGTGSMANPENRTKRLYEHSSSFGQTMVDNSITTGVSVDEIVSAALNEFNTYKTPTEDKAVLQSYSDYEDKIRSEITSHYETKYDEASLDSNRRFDRAETEILLYIDENDGNITRDAINEILRSVNYNPESVFDQANRAALLNRFGLIGGAEEAYWGPDKSSSSVSTAPGDKFLNAAKTYIGENGDIDPSTLEQLATDNGIDISSEEGQAVYQKGLQLLNETETKNSRQKVSDALISLYSTNVDWDKDVGVGLYDFSYNAGTIDADTSQLSADNQAMIQRFNNLNSVDNTAQPYVGATSLQPLAERVMAEYGISSPEEKADFLEGFSQWEKNVSGTKPPTAVEQDVYSKFYDISMDDNTFNSYLMGKVTSGEVSPGFATEILRLGDRKTLVERFKPIRDSMQKYLETLPWDDNDPMKKQLEYLLFDSMAAQKDLSQFYVRFGSLTGAELDNAIQSVVDTTYKALVSEDFAKSLDKLNGAVFDSFTDSDSWAVSDYKIYGFSLAPNRESAVDVYNAYLNGDLAFLTDGDQVALFRDGMLNGEITDRSDAEDFAAQAVFGKDYKDIKDDDTKKNIVDITISVGLTEATMTRIFQNTFGDRSPHGGNNWRTCRVDGKGIAYMNDGGVLALMSYKDIGSKNPVFRIYKFNKSDEEYQAVWGRNANTSYVLSLDEYNPAFFHASGINKKNKDIYSTPEYASAVRLAQSYRGAI